MKVDLTGKVAVVTGGGGILCSVMAEALAKSGAKVAILDLREENAQKVAEKINAAGGKAIGLAANVLELESLQQANEIIKAELGICDILINGAGGNNPKGTTSKEYLTKEDLAQKVEGLTTFFDLDPAGVGFVFNLNFLGTLLPTQVFARDMAEGNGGAIINISSVCALYAWPAWSVYTAAKAGLSKFSRGLYTELRPYGVRVFCVTPSWGNTGFNAAASIPSLSPELLSKAIQPAELGKLILQLAEMPDHLNITDITIQSLIQEINPM